MGSIAPAYLILAHSQPEQLARLVDRLTAAGGHAFVHLDRSVNGHGFWARTNDLPARADVTAVTRVRSHWGGFGVMEAIMASMSAALRSEQRFTHLSLLSGLDYPIKPVESLHGLLAARPHVGWLRYWGIPRDRPGDELGRLDRRYYRIGPRRYVWFPNRFVAFPPRRRFPLALPPYKGHAWWTLPRDLAQAVLDFCSAHPEYVRFFRRVFIPDEYFVQSVLVNSRYREALVDDDLRYIDFGDGRMSPTILTVSDVPALAASSAFFARKFDARVDGAVLDVIDRELLGRAGFGAGSRGAEHEPQ